MPRHQIILFRSPLPIVNACAKAFRVHPNIVLSPARSERACKARQVAMYLASVLEYGSVTDLAKFFQRDRTTLTYTIKLIEDMRDDTAFDATLSALEATLALPPPDSLTSPLTLPQ